MTKRIIVAVLVVGFLGYLVYVSELNFKPEPRKKYFEDKVKYSTDSYNPYDIKYIHDAFRKKEASKYIENDEKPDYANRNLRGENKLLVIISPYFLPNKPEVAELFNFADRGNNIFLSSINISPVFLDSLLGVANQSSFVNNYPPLKLQKDSLKLTWLETNTTYAYPGADILSFADESFNNSTINGETLCLDGKQQQAFVDFKIGRGHIFLQRKPMAMTNYFLLHKDNYQYLNGILKTVGFEQRTVVWDEFYRRHIIMRSDEEIDEPRDTYFWDLIARHPPLQWAVGTFFLAIFLFILLYSRRLQAPVAILPSVKNNSLEFIKSIAGLYWLKQDHKRIAEKITLQFHDYLTTNYRIYPKDVTEANAEKIAQKTNQKTEDVATIIDYIQTVNGSYEVSKQTLIAFYRKVFAFMNG